jgi:hypothetical protein
MQGSGGKFMPDDTASRPVGAIVTYNILKYSNRLPAVGACDPNNLSFQDVPCSSPYWTQIESIYKAGITTGCSTDAAGHKNFCINDPLTRGQAAALFGRTLQYLEYGTVLFSPATPTFDDVPTDYLFYKYIENFVTRSIELSDLSCSSNFKSFCPNASATRGFLTPFIINILQLNGPVKVKKITYTPIPNPNNPCSVGYQLVGWTNSIPPNPICQPGSSSDEITTPPGFGGFVQGAEKFVFTQRLMRGSTGNEVMELQRYLNNQGYNVGLVDGKFGPATETAVVKLEVNNGLEADGIVGVLVRSILNK